MRINFVPDVKCFFLIIKICYVHNQWYDISCATVYVEKIEASLKSDKSNGYFTRGPAYCTFMMSRSLLLRMRNISDSSGMENTNIHFVLNDCFPSVGYCGKIY